MYSSIEYSTVVLRVMPRRYLAPDLNAGIVRRSGESVRLRWVTWRSRCGDLECNWRGFGVDLAWIWRGFGGI